MSDKVKSFAAPSKTVKTKRPSTVGVPSSTTRKVTNPPKEKPKFAVKKNTTIIADGDTTILRQEGLAPDFNADDRQIAYGKFLRSMLEECIIDEKIEREETQMDLQMAQLAERFQKTMEQLDMTNRRLKDISFVVDQKRLLDLKSTDTSKFFNTTDDSNAQELLQNLNTAEKACLDNLVMKNVDFGFDKDSSHQQLLDAVNDAIEGLNEIKKHSNLDTAKFEEYQKSHESIQKFEKEKFDLETLKTDFEKRFPKFNEKLLKEASEKIAKMMEDDDDD
ncbi:hypothetical protein evm_010898 [Chilo suppressalis]|nr:hypothetical protein evm_010898 [Chilo suppressalis]